MQKVKVKSNPSQPEKKKKKDILRQLPSTTPADRPKNVTESAETDESMGVNQKSIFKITACGKKTKGRKRKETPS